MANGMARYEKEIGAVKTKLFSQLMADDTVKDILEVGVGAGRLLITQADFVGMLFYDAV